MKNFRGIYFLLALLFTIFAGSFSKRNPASNGPSDKPIATNVPNLPGGKIAGDPTPGPFLRDFETPYPTDSWWSGFTVKPQTNTAAGPFPFQSSTTNTGFVFGISDSRRFDGKSIHVETQRDLNVSIAGLPNDITNRKALSWDTQTVCLQYATDDKDTNTMSTCLVPGSPYMTFTFKNAVVVITSSKGNIKTFEWIQKGLKGKLTNDGGTYIIYVLNTPLELKVQGQTLVSPASYSGTVRFAKLKEKSQEALLDKYSGTYATGLVMSYKVNGNVSTQTWKWNVVGKPENLLILSYPHHRKTLEGAKYVSIEYMTLKGQMKGVSGNQWILKHNLPTLSFFPENSPQTSCLPELIKTLEYEVKDLKPSDPSEFYLWGGTFGAKARLALIAEHVGRMDLVEKVVSVMKSSVSHWFNPNHRPAAQFETGWGGVMGNQWYNDHHFIFGYFLAGAAVIGKYDPQWLNEHLDFFNSVARDIGNPSPNDPYITVTRHMDFFAGHSWASGIANGAGARDQESSSEAINGYYGLLLFAITSKNNALIDYSRLLLAMEIAGAQEYWHLYPKKSENETPYPEKQFRDLVTVGNVMDAQSGAWLFWGGQKIQIAAIQILPLTPIGKYTYDKDWMAEVVPYCQAEIDDVTIGDTFKSVIVAASSVVNPQKAYSASQNLAEWGSGNTASDTLYFIATQSSSKPICSAENQTPEGVFNIQDVSSGKYVTVSGGGSLAARIGADVFAEKFTLKFRPGGSTIQAANGKFVNADASGKGPLAASRDAAQSHEVFRWKRQQDGTYQLTAMVNRAQVSTAANGGNLVNNAGGTNGVTPSNFKLISANSSNPKPPPIPAQGVLQNVQSKKFVVSTSSKTTLMANGNNVGSGTKWAFEKDPRSSDDSPLYFIRSLATKMYVTGDDQGKSPLAAARAEPKSWETFRIVLYKNAYVILHVVSGLAAAIQSDSSVIDNNSAIDNNALWNIV